PLFMRLADLDEQSTELVDTIPKLIQRDYPKTWAGINALLKDKLSSGKCLLLLNALDEVPKANRNHLSDRINRFARIYPGSIICTSRIVGYGGAFLDGAKEVEIIPFSYQQTEQFVETWFEKAAGSISDDSISASSLLQELRNSPQIRRLAQNPRLLYLLCSLYQAKKLTLPARRCQIYEKTVTYLLSKGCLNGQPQLAGKIEAKIRLLEEIAYRFSEESKDIFSAEELVCKIGEYLNSDRVPIEIKSAVPEALLAELSEDGGIIHKLTHEGDKYVFIHRMTQDYLTASYLKRAIAENFNEGIASARNHFWDFDWHQSLSLLAGLMEHPVPLLEVITQEKDDIFSTLLLLAGRCIAECEENSHPLIAEILEKIYRLWHTYPFVGFIESTVVALSQANSQMLQRLQNELNEKHSYTRKDFIAALIAALGQIGSPQAVETLTKALNQRPWYIRGEAAAALGWTGDPQAVKALISALHDKDSIVRGEAAAALGGMGDSQAIEALVAALHDEDCYVRREAALALAQIGTPQALEGLAKVLNHEDNFIRWEATGACRICTPPVVTALLEALNHEDSHLREEATAVLGRIGSIQEAVEALIPALQDADSVVRREAAEALGWMGSCQMLPALISALQDEDTHVRTEAVKALGRIGNAQVLEVLLPMLQDADSAVRKYAVEALGQISGSQALEALIPALQDVDSDVRGAAAVALGQIGNPKALRALMRALRDRDWFVREQAAIALSRIGTVETLEQLLQLPKEDIYRPAIFSLIRTLAVRFSKESMPWIPVYPELIGKSGFVHRLWRKVAVRK
ncbi:MAG: HEAT repeat domain-containing protein, partial [Coleofasciculus sp. S288]|nr:HEAT repeat domain-containing protein [Coleofasciculus sp. S288]